jgi:uncharacterized glyoxalase superfamily protein PhnB
MEVPMSLCPFLRYDDAKAAIEFLGRAFGFEEKLVVPDGDGNIAHAQLALDGGVVMLGSTRTDDPLALSSARALGGVSSGIYVTVADPDAHHARAVAAGAVIVMPLTNQEYGSREYAARDPEGNLWSFGTYAP